MDFRDVIKNIYEGLTGDSENDIEYLHEQMERYKDDENATEIIRALGRKIFELLPQDKKDELNKIIGNDCDSIKSTIDEALFQIKQNNNAVRAEELFLSVIKSVSGMFKSDNECDYFCFDNPIQQMIYASSFNPIKTLRTPTYDYAMIYYFYGYCLIENKKFEEAEAALKTALEWNPVSTQIMFELAEIYKMNKSFDEYLYWTKQSLKYAYTANEVARCYRNLGYYYSDIGEYDLAAVLYYFSQFFCDTEITNSELFYIVKEIGYVPKQLSTTETQALFEKNDIQFGASEDVLSVVYSIGKQFAEINQINNAVYCFGIVYELTHDESIKGIIELLRKEDNSNE